jgi:hypothetical protein
MSRTWISLKVLAQPVEASVVMLGGLLFLVFVVILLFSLRLLGAMLRIRFMAKCADILDQGLK